MKKKRALIKKYLLPILVTMACSSCNRDTCPLSSGPGGTETRNLASFNEIVLYDKINLILTQDSVQKVIVGGGKNLLEGIETQVKDGLLTISNNNGCNWLRDPGYQINVYVSSSQLEKITYYGAGNITSTNSLLASQFTVDSWTGTGSITLSLVTGISNAYVRNNNAVITLNGQSDSSFIYCGEEGSVNEINFNSSYASVDSKSIENIYVNVSNSMRAVLAYKGNVYYKGNPVLLDTLISNSGKLIHLQ
jgi:hypothetical protein